MYAQHVGRPAPHLAAFGRPVTAAERLDEHLTTLGRHFEFAPLSEVLADNDAGATALAAAGGHLRRRLRSDRQWCARRPRAHRVKATTFVLTAMLGNRGLMWRNRLSAIIALRPAEHYVRAYNALDGARRPSGDPPTPRSC